MDFSSEYNVGSTFVFSYGLDLPDKKYSSNSIGRIESPQFAKESINENYGAVHLR